jgi:hypothetical protein
MDARTAARVGGWSAIVAGVTGALGATLLLAVPPGAPIDHFNYPLSPMWFVVVQAVFSVHHLLLAFVFWAFGRAGLAGRGALSAVGVWSTVTLFASFGVWEVLALSGIGRPYPSDELAWLDVGYGTLSLLLGVALILLGIAAVRARVFSGWARWATLATGVYVFVPMLPGLAAGFVAGRVVLGVWLLLFALLGWGMLRWSADSEPRPAFAAAAGAAT